MPVPPSTRALIAAAPLPVSPGTPGVPAVKLSRPGANCNWGPLPMPLSNTVCDDPAALSAIESVALKLATDEGVKLTAMVQLVEAARVLAQVVADVTAKSEGLTPPRLIPMPVSGALPVLESVVVSAVAVAPLGVAGKA